jgi:hypothetical protein
LTLQGLKAKEIEMKLTGLSADEAFQISAGKKWRMLLLQGRTKLGYDQRLGRLANSDLTQVIVELIRERPFLSCKMSCRHLRVSSNACLRILHEKLGLKHFDLR